MYLDDDELADYVAQFAQCSETGIFTAEGIELKAGFICGNRDGKSGGTGTYGPEIGLFLDDDCTVYYNKMDYYTAATGGYGYYNQNQDQNQNQQGRKLQDQKVLTESQLSTLIEYVVEPYKSGISCEAWPVFDEYDANGNNNDQQQDQQQEEANYEANEICQQIMQAEAVPLATCGYDNNQEQQEAEEEAEDEWEANDYNFLYEYELKEQDVDDIAAVCTFYNTYDFQGYQGNIYEGEVHYKPERTSGFSSMGDMSAGAKFGIAVLVIAVVGGIAFVALKKKKASDADYRLEPLHDSKGASA